MRRAQARLVVKLFNDEAPLAVENFLRLCKGQEKDSLLKYLGCMFHRIIPGFIAQSRDMQFGNGSGNS